LIPRRIEQHFHFHGSRSFATEGDMTRLNWNTLLEALVLIRLGQELGTQSQLARAVHEVVASFLAVLK
jgi:hypothetical protein